MKRYNTNLENCSSPENRKKKASQYIYDTPNYTDNDGQRTCSHEAEEMSKMEISENEEEESDEGHPTNTIYQNHTNIEHNADGTFTCFSSHDDNIKIEDFSKSIPNINEKYSPSRTIDINIQTRKHKMMGYILKRKRRKISEDNEHKSSTMLERHLKSKRGKRRVPRSEKNARRKNINEITQISTLQLQKLNKRTLAEYVPDQQGRHKKAITDSELKTKKNNEATLKEKKKSAIDAVTQLLERSKNNVASGLKSEYKKEHNLRKRTLTDYTSQLDDKDVTKYPTKRYKDPVKPRYTLNDSTVLNKNAFMIAFSNLQHNIQGVFAREAIPLRGNRKLFKYTSENDYETTQSDQVDQYLAYKSDNKFVVHIGNVVVDVTSNTNSYCNHVKELLSHKTPFNCKYFKSGKIINIVQISPIAKNEELNIQYSRDGTCWKNRNSGYPEEILK